MSAHRPWWFAAICLAGCALGDSRAQHDGGPSAVNDEDGGLAVSDGAVTRDGGGRTSDAELGASDAASPSTSDGGFASGGEDGAACWNFEDDDGNGVLDCDEAGCAADRACCVGRLDAPCCTSETAELTFAASCAGPSCALWGDTPTSWRAAGAREIVAEGSCRPGIATVGGLDTDGRLVDTRALSPRIGSSRYDVTIEAGALPSSGLDAIGVGLYRDLDAVDPWLTAVVNGDRLLITLAGTTLDALELSAIAPCADRRLSIVVDAHSVAVSSDEMAWRSEIDAPAELFFAFTGRSLESSAPARVVAATRTRATCPVLAPLVDAVPLAVANDGASFDGFAAIDVERSVVAYDGALYVTTGLPNALDLTTANRIEAAGFTDLRDPSYVPPSDDALATGELYFSALHEGERVVARAAFGATMQTISPVVLALPMDADDPFAFRNESSVVELVLRLGGRFVRFVPGAGGGFDEGDSTNLSPGALSVGIYQPTGGDRFDADEIADPFVVVDAQRTRWLLYAGRRANRWSLGLLVSRDGVHYAATPAPILRASDVTPTLDGVRHGALIARDQRLSLLFAGEDGARDRAHADGVYRATQAVPAGLR